MRAWGSIWTQRVDTVNSQATEILPGLSLCPAISIFCWTIHTLRSTIRPLPSPLASPSSEILLSFAALVSSTHNTLPCIVGRCVCFLSPQVLCNLLDSRNLLLPAMLRAAPADSEYWLNGPETRQPLPTPFPMNQKALPTQIHSFSTSHLESARSNSKSNQ